MSADTIIALSKTIPSLCNMVNCVGNNCTSIISKLEQGDIKQKKQAALDFINQIQKFENSDTFLNEIWSETVSQSPTEVTQIIENYDDTSEAFNKTIDELKECSKKHTFKMANESMNSYLKTNAIAITSQVFILRNTWREINEADNVIKDENLFKEINANIEKLGLTLDEYKQLIDNYKENHVDFTKAVAKSNNLKLMYTKTISLLQGVKIKIGSKIQTLNLRHNDSVREMITNGVQTMQSAANLYRLWNDLSSLNRILGAVSITMFSYITYQHNENRKMTLERIDELGKLVSELEVKEHELDAILADITLYNDKLSSL